VALLQYFELGFGPLRAVIIAPGVLLLLDLVDLVAEIIDIGLLAARQRPVAVLALGLSTDAAG
jgi:hypothetical protein